MAVIPLPTVFSLELFSSDLLNSAMEVLRCFNCDHTGRRQEDFFNITNIHPSFTGKSKTDVETGPNESLKESTFLVCCDCVYDRLQECHSCSKKAPLCMFKLAEWFTDKKNRNCIDCAAMFEAQELFQTGYHSSVIIRQCLVCRHFKYLPSFIAWSKHKPYETLKDCFECQLRQDIVQYKRKVRDRYERKLQQEPVLGDDKPLTTETGARTEVLSHKGTTYASVVTKGQIDGKSSSSSCENDRVKTPALETIAQLNIPNAMIGLYKGKCFSTGLDGKHNTSVFVGFIDLRLRNIFTSILSSILSIKSFNSFTGASKHDLI